MRSKLHRRGFRFLVAPAKLPGRPDIVLPKYGYIIFVHGCFWHRHKGCKKSTMPKSNVEFWSRKFEANTERDQRKRNELEKIGWKVMVVWECELKNNGDRIVEAVAKRLRKNIHLSLKS